jgi:phospholipase C
MPPAPCQRETGSFRLEFFRRRDIIGDRIMALTDIEHIVVVMMENRSFDNLLGWLYDNQTNPPKFNIPDQQPPVYEGLKLNTYSNVLNGSPIPVSYPPTAWPPANNPNVVPTPDPNEEFVYVTNQLFGTKTPAPGATANMSGFLQDYSTTPAGVAGAGQIMETFGPTDANVINDLAKNFAVCDHWYASVPSQTWPNRAFVHSGSSDGHINNDDYELYDIPTIFNVLENQGKTWGVFHDTTYIPSLTLTQFSPQLLIHTNRFFKYDVFEQLCSAAATAPVAQKLPQYSFVEPRFTPELGFGGTQYPADYHPPHNICRGEQFLAGVYQAVSASPYRDKILLVITFDEHGGCYDHVPPPTGSAAPNPKPVSNDGSFKFDRFGVRVPTIIISSYVQPGTVFRAPQGQTPFDHTSLLATIRDWLSLDADPKNPFLPSPRIQNAPTMKSVLTLDDTNKNTNWPTITANCTVGTDDQSLQTPLSQLQQSLIAGAIRQNSDDPHDPATVAQSTAKAKSLKTYADAIQFMHPDLPVTPIKQ